MKYRLLTVAKKAEPALESLCSKYEKRIGGFRDFEQLNISPGKGDGAIYEEQQALLKKLKEGSLLVLLDETGKQISSPELARQLEIWEMRSKEIVFVIGGAYGSGPDLFTKATFILSLTSMTLPHELARLFFTEQLYRALCIRAGHPYHHI